MASRESISIQMAGVDGELGCTPSPEALLVRVPSIAGRFDDVAAAGHDASSAEAADVVGGMKKDAAAVISVPAAAVHDETRGETPYSVSFSVPASPSGLHLAQLGMPSIRSSVDGDVVVVRVGAEPPSETRLEVHPTEPRLLKQARFHSQPSLAIRGAGEAPVPRSDSTRERDRRFDHFKTFSGRLEWQLSSLRGLPQEPAAADVEHAESKISEEDTDGDNDVPTADRYFAALEGPELETLRATEVAVLPKDETWPFLLRFPISAFGMCLGVSSQAMLWKTLESEPSTAFLRVHTGVNHVLWWVSVALMVLVSALPESDRLLSA